LSDINKCPKTITFGICNIETGQLVGYAGIASISTLNRSGEFFILIGAKDHWGKGIGTEVTKLITEYGFKTLGLHRVELTVYASNGLQLEPIRRRVISMKALKESLVFAMENSLIKYKWGSCLTSGRHITSF